MLNLRTQLEQVIYQLSQLGTLPHVVVGFDGYVDAIKKVVRQRSEDQVQYYQTMPELAKRIEYAAGKSAQLEIVPITTKSGGNAPIMGQTLGSMGFETTCIGPLGEGEPDQVFSGLVAVATLHTLGPPASSTAWEFQDGKLILSDLSPFDHVDWNHIRHHLGDPVLKKCFGEADMMALVGLSNMPHATALLNQLATEWLPELPPRPRKIFVDLADPTRMSDNALEDMIQAVEQYRNFGVLVLGLNENEALHLHKVLFPGTGDSLDLEGKSQALFERLNVDALLVHPMDRALVIDEAGMKQVPGRLVLEPKVLTGGGDNFNAGFCLGWAAGMDLNHCLILGVSTAGAYISQGYSPDLGAVQTYLKEWLAEQ